MVDNLALRTRKDEVLVPTEAEITSEAETTSTNLPTMTYDQKTFDDLLTVFNNDVPKFTRSMVKILGKQFDDTEFMTYQGLKTGTSPVFNLFPKLSKLPPEKRRLTDEQIIKLFAFDPQGRAISPGTFLEGFKREVLPQAASVPSFMAGFSAGQTMVAGVPPVTIPTAIIRFGVPLATGTIAALGGYTLGEEINKQVLGDERVMLPHHQAAYESGKTAAGALTWLSMPFLVKNQLNFGVQSARNALFKEKGIEGKPTVALKIAQGLESTVGRVGKIARENPVAFGLAEGLAGIGQTGGAYIAEDTFPGSTPARLTFEFGGAITVPALNELVVKRLYNTLKATPKAFTFVKEGGIGRIFKGLNKEREREVINFIIDSIENAGEDVDEIIKKLSSNEFTDILVDNDGNPIKLTSALKSASPALLVLEKSLEKTTRGLAKERGSANIQVSRALRNIIAASFASSDPNALQGAADIMQSLFQADLEGPLADQMKKVFEAFEAIGSPSGRQAKLSENLQEILTTRLKEARIQEKRLWQSVDRNIPMDFGDSTPEFITFMEGRLPNNEFAKRALDSDLNPIIGFFRRQAGLEEGAEPEVLNAQDMYEMYSTALSIAKKLGTKGDNAGESIAYGFAQSILKDLNNNPVNDPNYLVARSYSRALNDAFTRSFVNDALATQKTGALKIAPELLAKNVFSADAGYLRLKQLDQVGQFELTQALTNIAQGRGEPDLQKVLNRLTKFTIDEDTGLVDVAKLNRWLSNNRKSLSKYPKVLADIETAVQTTSSIRGTTENILRNILTQSQGALFDKQTGLVNPKVLSNWMAKPENQDILSAMPALKADLENAETANVLLKNIEKRNVQLNKDIKETVSFMDLLTSSTESPATAAGKALSKNNKTPVRSWDNLLKVVKEAPNEWQVGNVTYTKKDALEGLKSAFIKAAMTDAGGTSETFDARRFFENIFAPHRYSKGDVSLAEWMKTNNVMDEKQLKQLRTFSEKLIQMEAFVAKGDVNLEDLAETVGPMMDFYLRISGASLGSRMQSLIPGDTGSGSLVAAGAGSKAFRQVYSKIFKNIPESLKMDVMTQMFEDPELLAVMLSKGRNERQRSNIASRILQILSEKGFTAVTSTLRRGLPATIREGGEKDLDPIRPDNFPVTVPKALESISPINLSQVNPPAQIPTATLQAQAQPSSGSADPNTRTRYASLFPDDPISGMLGSGGITNVRT